jgi:hypothetical protein
MNNTFVKVKRDLSHWNDSQLHETFFGMDSFYVITYFIIINFSNYLIK